MLCSRAAITTAILHAAHIPYDGAPRRCLSCLAGEHYWCGLFLRAFFSMRLKPSVPAPTRLPNVMCSNSSMSRRRSREWGSGAYG